MKLRYELRHLPERGDFCWVIWDVVKDKMACAVDDEEYAKKHLQRYIDTHCKP